MEKAGENISYEVWSKAIQDICGGEGIKSRWPLSTHNGLSDRRYPRTHWGEGSAVVNDQKGQLNTEVSVPAAEIEALMNRVANVRYIWYTPNSLLLMDGQRMGSPVESDWNTGSTDDGSNQDEGYFSKFDEKEAEIDRCLELRSSKQKWRTQMRSQNDRKKGASRDSYGVTISSKEKFASSTPMEFQDINLDGSGTSKARRKVREKPMICNFCKNNRELRDIYLTHYLYDPVTKVLACPVLRKHICEICGGTGDYAHTLQYCRINRERGLSQGNVPKMLNTHSVTNSAGKIRKN